MNGGRQRATRRVLIVKLGAIGDVLMAIPAVDRLRQSLDLAQIEPQGPDELQGTGAVTARAESRAASPRVAIDWVIGRTLLPLLEGYPWIRPIAVDAAALLRGGALERLRELRKLRGQLRGQYDLIATLYYDRRYQVLTRSVRARRRLALSRRQRDCMLLPGRHHTDEFARILLSLPDVCREESLPPLPPETLPAAPIPRRADGGRRIALVPAGASNMMRAQTLRRWPLENYVALASALSARGDQVVLIGGPDDAWALPAFAHFRPGAVIDTIGQIPLPEVLALLNTCDAVVTHDTGPMHLAGQSTAELVALFGPTDPGNFLPRRPGVWGVWGGEGFACRPCYDGTEFAPCPSNGCMQQIVPAAVLALLDRALLSRASGEREGVWPRLLLPSQLVERVA